VTKSRILRVSVDLVFVPLRIDSEAEAMRTQVQSTRLPLKSSLNSIPSLSHNFNSKTTIPQPRILCVNPPPEPSFGFERGGGAPGGGSHSSGSCSRTPQIRGWRPPPAAAAAAAAVAARRGPPRRGPPARMTDGAPDDGGAGRGRGAWGEGEMARLWRQRWLCHTAFVMFMKCFIFFEQSLDGPKHLAPWMTIVCVCRYFFPTGKTIHHHFYWQLRSFPSLFDRRRPTPPSPRAPPSSSPAPRTAGSGGPHRHPAAILLSVSGHRTDRPSAGAPGPEWDVVGGGLRFRNLPPITASPTPEGIFSPEVSDIPSASCLWRGPWE